MFDAAAAPGPGRSIRTTLVAAASCRSAPVQPGRGRHVGREGAGVTVAAGGTPLRLAEDAVGLAQTDPRQALRQARALAGDRQPPEVRSVALRAAGLALSALLRPADALAELWAAARVASRAGLPHREGEARMSAAWILYTAGRGRAALAEADRAAALLDGGSLDRLRAQRAVISHRLGRVEEALAGYAAALVGLVRRRDRFWEASLRNNRAVLYAELNEIGLARTDLLRAGDLFRALDMDLAVAQVQHNLGFVAARAGEAVAALNWYRQAEEGFAAVGVPPTVIVVDRAELLLQLRLGEDAMAVAARAVELCGSAGLGASLAEAQVLLAEAACLVGDTGRAARAAQDAVRAFRRQRRPAWALLAERVRLIGLLEDAESAAGAADQSDSAFGAVSTVHAAGSERVRVRTSSSPAPTGPNGTTGPNAATRPDAAAGVGLAGFDAVGPAGAPTDLLAASRRLARRLDAAGWEPLAVDAHLRAARLARRLGRLGVARVELERAAGRSGRLPALSRARVGYARAALAELRGDRAAALRALGQATGIARGYAAALGALDLRTGAASYASEFTELGVRLAREAGRPAGVLRWSELGRAFALTAPPAAPPDDAELARLLTELRRVAALLRQATTAGDDPRPLVRRQARVEEAVRALARRTVSAPGTLLEPVSARRLTAHLGSAPLVSYLDVEGELVALVCHRGRLRTQRLAPLARLAPEVERLLLALRRLSLGYGQAEVLAQRRTLAGQTADRLDAALIRPLGLPADGTSVVLVPTGVLHGLPWSALPSLAGRPVVVAPSATLWATRAGDAHPDRAGRAPGPPARTGPTVLVAGPDLPDAVTEVADLAATLPAATVLTGDAATVAATLAALDGSDIGHIACHGEFRPGNPLFSTLRLADGPLTVYDLHRLAAVPRTMVLSACDAARSVVTVGDGLLGLSATLLSLGTRTLVAPLVAVPDEATRALMIEFHRGLAAGLAPATALRDARLALPDDPRSYVTAAAFVCLGHG